MYIVIGTHMSHTDMLVGCNYLGTESHYFKQAIPFSADLVKGQGTPLPSFYIRFCVHLFVVVNISHFNHLL